MRVGLLLMAAWAVLLGALSSCEDVSVQPTTFGKVAVTVLDARTNQPLPNTGISTNPATGSYVTDAQGKLTISDLPAGLVAITARRTGYTQLTTNVNITSDQTQSIVLQLEKPTNAAAPNAPVRPGPASGATGQPSDVALSWHPSGANKADSLRYDVILFESNNLNQRTLLTNSKDTVVVATGLLYNTTYYWQVTVRNPAGASARSPVWSFQTGPLPDNRYLFARTSAGNTDVYSSDNMGGGLVRLTTSSAVETAPQLSPLRDIVAYTSNATGQYQLYTMNRDGSNQRQITALSVEGYSNAGVGYRWSPDGAQLIYAHYDQLYRINRDGSGLMLLATAPAGRHFRECDWTSQGNRLVVQTIGSNPFDSELYLYNVDGTNPVLFVSNLPGRVDSPSFSIDGTRIVYTRDVAGFNSPAGRQLDSHIFIQRVDGTGTPVDVSAGTGVNNNNKITGTNDLTPRYSPDGFRLIFVNRVNDDLSPPELWTATLDGTSRAKIITNAFLPDWK
ncbi:carboxypeptidase-like regulatory domain-containing protein [Hymenobacter sp. UYCo722]|uniref:carboxypeptidase-like regulatory domain-containing protein n=1 Tax=Hymenobacter sp. UYCo722 TaxID=3156335 RepID=UPI0033969139